MKSRAQPLERGFKNYYSILQGDTVMSKNWDRENMMTLAANVRKEDAEAFARIARENNTTVGVCFGCLSATA